MNDSPEVNNVIILDEYRIKSQSRRFEIADNVSVLDLTSLSPFELLVLATFGLPQHRNLVLNSLDKPLPPDDVA